MLKCDEAQLHNVHVFCYLFQEEISRILLQDRVDSDDYVEDQESADEPVKEADTDNKGTDLDNKDNKGTDLANKDSSLDHEVKSEDQVKDHCNFTSVLSDTSENEAQHLDGNTETNLSKLSPQELLTDQSKLVLPHSEPLDSEITTRNDTIDQSKLVLPHSEPLDGEITTRNDTIDLESKSEESNQEKQVDQSGTIKSETEPPANNEDTCDKELEAVSKLVDESDHSKELSESVETNIAETEYHNNYSSQEYKDEESTDTSELEEPVISQSCDNYWPLSNNSGAVVNFVAIEDKYFENGDFCFFLNESDTGQVRLYLKYALDDSTTEIVIPESEFGKVFTMEWKEDNVLESSEELGSLLQNCLVNLEDSVDKLRWEDVVASTGPFHHGNVRLKQSFMSTTKVTSDFGNKTSINSESALPKNVFNSQSGYNGNSVAANCDRSSEEAAPRSYRQNMSYHVEGKK